MRIRECASVLGDVSTAMNVHLRSRDHVWIDGHLIVMQPLSHWFRPKVEPREDPRRGRAGSSPASGQGWLDGPVPKAKDACKGSTAKPQLAGPTQPQTFGTGPSSRPPLKW
jgi:hypothetical protein